MASLVRLDADIVLGMTVLQWERQQLSGSFFKKLRREIRTYRREKGRSGHGFIHDDVRVLWASGDSYAILSHNLDRVWQFWWRHPEHGWFLQSWHKILSDAKIEADKPRIFDVVLEKKRPSGTYVCGEWIEAFQGTGPMMVLCSSEYTASEIKSVFESLGCRVATKAVA